MTFRGVLVRVHQRNRTNRSYIRETDRQTEREGDGDFKEMASSVVEMGKYAMYRAGWKFQQEMMLQA